MASELLLSPSVNGSDNAEDASLSTTSTFAFPFPLFLVFSADDSRRRLVAEPLDGPASAFTWLRWRVVGGDGGNGGDGDSSDSRARFFEDVFLDGVGVGEWLLKRLGEEPPQVIFETFPEITVV